MARSRLYQSRCLQVNTHFAEFFEIYKILCTFAPLHPENLQIFSLLCTFFANVFLEFEKKMLNSLQKLSIFAAIFAEFCRNSVKLQKITAKLN